MRYFLFLILMIFHNVFAVDIKDLPHGDNLRKQIAQALREEEGLQDSVLNLRRIGMNVNYSGEDIAYICGLIKDKSDQFQPDAQNKYHLYDRVMTRGSYYWNWISVVRFDRQIDSPQEVHCHYGKDVPLSSTELWELVKAQGRKNICQPVQAKDPLRRDILDGLRASYVGDSNSLTLNGPLPAVKFVVADLCSTENYAWFTGKPMGDAQSYYRHSDGDTYSELNVVLKKSSDGVWRPQPQHLLLVQQSKTDTAGYRGTLREIDLAQMAQACMVEGDTVSLTGTLHQQGSGESAYWTLTPDSPLTCVRDANKRQPGWNQTMQLVLTPQERESLKDLVGKKVSVGGDIFLALSASHHTPLLLDNIFRLTEIK